MKMNALEIRELFREGYRKDTEYRQTIDMKERQEKERIQLMLQRVSNGTATTHEYLTLGYQQTEAENAKKEKVKEIDLSSQNEPTPGT